MVPARPSVLARMVIPPRRQMQREYLYGVVGGVFGGSARRHPEHVAAAMRDGDWLGSPLGHLYQLVAAAGWTSLPFLPAIRQPALIVAGNDDPIIPLANARLMNPGVTVLTVIPLPAVSRARLMVSPNSPDLAAA